MVSLGCWAEQPQLWNVTSCTRQNRSQSDAPGPKTDLRIDSLRPERPDAMVQGLEGRSLWAPPLRGSLEQLDRPSPAGPPFQGTELAALSTPEASLKRLVLLVSHLVVWEPLPSVSYWDLPEHTLVPSLP